MNKIFYLYGDEPYLINEEIKKIIEINPDSKIINFDFDYKINDVLNEISSFSIFDSKKIVIFNQFPLLTKKNDQEINSIINSIKFMPESTTLIFTSEKINEKSSKNQLLSFLKKESVYKEFKKLNDKEIIEISRKKINELGGTISEIDLLHFLNKVPKKLSIIFNEIEKLVSLDKNISRSSIEDLIPKYELDNGFEFINAFHNQDVESLFKAYYSKIEQGETIQNLIGQIASTLELCSKIYSYKMLKYNNDEIANELNKHPFVIKKNDEFLNMLTYKKINEYLNHISNLDVDIKKGKIDEKIGFERFLLETIK